MLVLVDENQGKQKAINSLHHIFMLIWTVLRKNEKNLTSTKLQNLTIKNIRFKSY